MPRTNDDIIQNILASSRRILAALTHMEFINDNEAETRKLLARVLKLPMVLNLGDKLLTRFLANIFRIWDIQTINFAVVETQIANKQRHLRKQFSNFNKSLTETIITNKEHTNENVIDEHLTVFWTIYDESKLFVREVLDKYPQLTSVENIASCEFKVAAIVSALNKVRYIGLQTQFFQLINFGDVRITVEETNNWKMIAFQLGQKMALMSVTNNSTPVEIFTKEDAVLRYPVLKEFLFRRELTPLNKRNFQTLLFKYCDEVYKFVTPEMTEIPI